MPAAPDAGRQSPHRDPQLKTLVIRPGAIGDTIVSLPALEYLQPDEVWVSSACVPLIQFAPARSIASTGLDLLELGRETHAPELLSRFDSIVSWYGAARPEFRDAVARWPFEFCRALPPEGTDVHATDFYLQQVGAPPGAVPSLRIKSDPRDFIAMHPFSGSAKKNWPLRQFEELARRLRLPVEYAELPEESHRFENLRELAAWLAGARLYIGNDSGITHLAAALGVPVIAIFRCTNPAVWAPRGNVHVLELPETGAGEDSAQVAIVAGHAERLIELDRERRA